MHKLRVAAAITILSASMLAAGCRTQSLDRQLGKAVGTASAQLHLQAGAFDTLNFYPRSIKDGAYEQVKHADWTCGFFPGSLWLGWELTGDESLKEAAVKYTARLRDVVARPGTHDLGFMVNCSFGRMLDDTGDPDARAALMEAAEALAKRYDERIGLIRSWDFGKWNYPVIIDNMMNLELLFKASELGGIPRYREIAVNHADKTMLNHFRSDASVYHVVSYNDDGSIESKGTYQGYADESTWSRGEAWALYGYLICYRYTRDGRYLDHAKRVATYIMDNPSTPADRIPYWDSNAPGTPGSTAPADDTTGLVSDSKGHIVPARDASAAAITASALLEMSTFTTGEWQSRCISEAEAILRSLSSPEYLAAPGSNMGFILKHCTGAASLGSEIDVPLNYADYYFLEAIERYYKITESR